MKKFMSLVAAIVICLAMGVTAIASTDSPTADDPHNDQSGAHTGTELESGGSGTGMSGTSDSISGSTGTSSDPSASPSTGDVFVVPALAGIALSGGTLAGVSKSKMKKQDAE